jgi:hypothetical protein
MLQAEQVQSLIDNYQSLHQSWFIYQGTTDLPIEDRLEGFGEDHIDLIEEEVDTDILAVMLTQPDHLYDDNLSNYRIIEADDEEEHKQTYAEHYYEECVEHEVPDHIRKYVDVSEWIEDFIAYESLLNLQGYTSEEEIAIDGTYYIVYTL